MSDSDDIGSECDSYKKALKDRIWFTRKARIIASERLLMEDFHSQALLVTYTTVDVVLSIISLSYPHFISDTISPDLMLTVLSVAILVLSLFIYSRNLKERGLLLKNNYIELQKLEDTVAIAICKNISIDGLSDKYAELLKDCENHLSIDDKYFRVISSGGTTSRPGTWIEYATVWIYVLFRAAVLILLYAAPIVLIAWVHYKW